MIAIFFIVSIVCLAAIAAVTLTSKRKPEAALSHTELIVCPECNQEELATVEHTEPFWTYVHHCSQCGHCILESEWQVANPGRRFSE